MWFFEKNKKQKKQKNMSATPQQPRTWSPGHNIWCRWSSDAPEHTQMCSRKIGKKLQNWHFWVLFSNYGFHNWHFWPPAIRKWGDTPYKLFTTISSRWNTSESLKKQMSHFGSNFFMTTFTTWNQLFNSVTTSNMVPWS